MCCTPHTTSESHLPIQNKAGKKNEKKVVENEVINVYTLMQLDKYSRLQKNNNDNKFTNNILFKLKYNKVS